MFFKIKCHLMTPPQKTKYLTLNNIVTCKVHLFPLPKDETKNMKTKRKFLTKTLVPLEKLEKVLNKPPLKSEGSLEKSFFKCFFKISVFLNWHLNADTKNGSIEQQKRRMLRPRIPERRNEWNLVERGKKKVTRTPTIISKENYRKYFLKMPPPVRIIYAVGDYINNTQSNLKTHWKLKKTKSRT